MAKPGPRCPLVVAMGPCANAEATGVPFAGG